MNKTGIEWATMTWNPITGCSPISEGCANCYAARMAHRLAGRCGYDKEKPFGVTLHRDKLTEPIGIHNPQRIFVCSMGDLFHEDVPWKWINCVWTAMIVASDHKFMVLTKRPERMRQFFAEKHHSWQASKSHDFIQPHVWLGVTAENQARADERIPVLLSIPAAGHFVSVEPMLGPVDLTNKGLHNAYSIPTRYADGVGIEWTDPGDKFIGLDWVICGAETGPKRRAIQQEWVFDLERQCEEANVPFFGKKWSDGFPMSRREIPAGLEVTQ